MSGKFITFEGGEGTGKSTQAAMLALRLESLGIGVLLTREPGGSPGAEIIRHVLLSGAAKPLGPDAEAMLFAAARDDHIQLRHPAGARRWQMGDLRPLRRFHARLSGRRSARSIHASSRRWSACRIGDLKPDLTLVLDVPVEVGLKRAAGRRRGGQSLIASKQKISSFTKSCARPTWRWRRPRAAALRRHRRHGAKEDVAKHLGGREIEARTGDGRRRRTSENAAS